MSGLRRRCLLWAGLAAPHWGVKAGPATVPPAAAPAPPARSAPDAASADAAAADDRIDARRALRFPRDHGAHAGARIEWWYATGWLTATADAAPIGFQLTFFRSRTGLATDLPGRFAPRQLLFAHAAVSDIGAGRHRSAQRIARWSGDARQPESHAARDDADVVLGAWRLRRGDGRLAAQPRATATARDDDGSLWHARLAAPEAGFTLDLTLRATQPILLQGAAGHSRKGPLPGQASHYYSQPQLAVSADLTLDARRRRLAGTAWLDHEWSDELLPSDAVGWDWLGINLADGGALTAFRLRRADGSVAWAGGSHRPRGGAVRDFAADELRFTPLRHWTSPASGARYPVRWRIATPAGEFELEALLDAQELDSRASTGAVYWEGLAELRQAAGTAATRGARLGLGYLEMTGVVSPLRLGGVGAVRTQLRPAALASRSAAPASAITDSIES